MVFDEKVLHIGNALLVEQDDMWLNRTNSPFPEATMEAYGKVLPKFRSVAVEHGVQLLEVERASFTLSDKLGTQADRP